MSASRLEPCIPLPLKPQVLEELVQKSKDWALMHGAGMRSKTNFSEDGMYFAPFVLLPSTFPRKEFQKAVEIQTILNELIHKVAHDYEFLSTSLQSTVKVDEFTGNLFRIYETVHRDGQTQRVSLGLIRSDIMLESHCPSKATEGNAYCCWKQVELNTIASGFGWLGPASAGIHRFVLQELDQGNKVENIPENGALTGLCEGMLEAWKLYGNSKAVIMFVVEDVTYNICDQRFHEFEIRRLNPAVRVMRRTLTQISRRGTLNKETKELIVDGIAVAVIYFRAGYEPGHYHTQAEWEARLMMERSLAIKCPSIHYHLAGTKKVQQALAYPNTLERFIKDPAKVEAIREIFTGLYSLELDERGDEAVKMAVKDPEHYVLKPQREGGGNNVYGMKVREMLQQLGNSAERSAWILMERIIPPVQKGYMIRPGGPCVPEPVDLVSELGIFGVIIGTEDTIYTNRQVGYMLRTKLSDADEGGVAAGSGALDSPFLIS